MMVLYHVEAVSTIKVCTLVVQWYDLQLSMHWNVLTHAKFILLCTEIYIVCLSLYQVFVFLWKSWQAEPVMFQCQLWALPEWPLADAE